MPLFFSHFTCLSGFVAFPRKNANSSPPHPRRMRWCHLQTFPRPQAVQLRRRRRRFLCVWFRPNTSLFFRITEYVLIPVPSIDSPSGSILVFAILKSLFIKIQSFILLSFILLFLFFVWKEKHLDGCYFYLGQSHLALGLGRLVEEKKRCVSFWHWIHNN